MADAVAWALLGLMGAGTLLSFVRLMLGRTVADRAVALDAATLITTNVMVLSALLSGRSFLLDVALVYAVLSFLGVLALARYLDGGIR